MKYCKIILVASLLLITGSAIAKNNSTASFSKAKKILLKEVYYDHRKTIYCNADFNAKKHITAPAGFETAKYIKRSKKIEWEHVVPAENFGRTFVEWREGDDICVSKKGKSYKGRKCANKTSKEYRYMQADMFNLYPAIGAVNALRSNYNFTMLPTAKSDFGSCKMKIENRKAEPPKQARGRIARTYLYMDLTYPRYSMSKQQKQLMTAWDKQYSVSQWECLRAERITTLQGSSNQILNERCGF